MSKDEPVKTPSQFSKRLMAEIMAEVAAELEGSKPTRWFTIDEPSNEANTRAQGGRG